MAEDFTIYRRRLPHWRQTGVTYFVTWRLHSTQLPLAPNERTVIVNSIEHFNNQRYKLAAHVVMDDHVHVLLKPCQPYHLQQILHSWKSYTAHYLQQNYNRNGCVWQSESFDRIIRDEQEFNEKLQYILRNPFKRWPEIQDYTWLHTMPVDWY